MKKGAATVGVGFAASWVLAFAVGCKGDKDAPTREPPPPPASVAPNACASGGKKPNDADAAKVFPSSLSITTQGRAEDYCLDPNDSEKAFGEGAKEPIDGICDLFDGECEIYKGFGVRHVVELRYVNGGGKEATVEAHLSRFGTKEGAFAMFTKRVVGDGDPKSPDTPKPVEVTGEAALGKGIGYVWRGNMLVELTYSDTSAAEASLVAAGDAVLPTMMEAIAKDIPGEATLPPAAAALPGEHLLPLGVRYVTKDLLGVSGIGGGAIGYYADGEKRYRFAALDRVDVDQAKDAIASFAKQRGASIEKDVAEGAARFMKKDEALGDPAEAEWIVARMGKKVLAIGDEPRAVPAGAPAEAHAKVNLTREEKIERLKKALTSR